MNDSFKLIAGNWKMNGDLAMAVPLLASVAEAALRHAEHVRVVICPPAPLLYPLGHMLKDGPMTLGAQDCHAEDKGAHTGDTSAAMLKDAGCRYVIVGHSERRAAYSETDEEIKKKAEKAMEYGLLPIICVGEALEERKAGRAEEIVSAQVKNCVPTGQKGDFVLAYEPVWAIGSGLTPEDAEIEAMHKAIRRIADVPVLYGGSVKAENARGILALPDVGGALVGGASLNADAFAGIISAAELQKI